MQQVSVHNLFKDTNAIICTIYQLLQ